MDAQKPKNTIEAQVMIFFSFFMRFLYSKFGPYAFRILLRPIAQCCPF
jgi:hypothetical protein